MKEINHVVINERLKHIKEGLENLKNFLKISRKDFLSDRKLISAVKYEIIKTFEAISSICSHIIVKKFGIRASSYAECFEILKEKKIISKELANNLCKMARFRNLIIHMYQKVDDEKVYEILKNGIKDIEEYMKVIERKFLKT